jgi:hypothetical protein
MSGDFRENRLVDGLGYGQVVPALFRRTPGPYQRDYYTSANHEVGRELRIRRGQVGIRPRVSVGFGVASHPSGA